MLKPLPSFDPPHASLIGADDPAPFVVLNEHGAAPMLVVCDHASRAFPKRTQRLGLPEYATWQHIAWDLGAAELARGLAHALDAPAVLAGYSRLVVDCNRKPGDVDAAFRTVSDGWAIPGNAGLSEVERQRRLAEFFDPYHGAVDAMLRGFAGRDVVPMFVSVHSFTPSLGGNARPWHIGILWDQDGRVAEPLLAQLRAIEGLCVGDNEPYSGRHPADFTVDHHAEAAGLPHVCLEVRQDLLESPAGVERWVRILAREIGTLLGEPAIHRPFQRPAKNPKTARQGR